MWLVLWLFACKPGSVVGPDDSGGDDPATCHGTPAPADADRLVVASLPYDAAGGPSDGWAAFRLDASGELAATDIRFEMGRAFSGRVAWTPDGAIGIATQENGGLGVFRVDGDAIEVVHAAVGDVYATDVWVDPSGSFALVADGNWRENGGGLYRFDIACDGTLTQGDRVVESKQPAAIVPEPSGGRLFVPARDLADSAPGENAHLVDAATLARAASAAGFPDDEAVMASAAWTSDGRYVMVGDNAGFSAIPNRVAVLEVTAGGLVPAQVLDLPDPVALVASPLDGTVLAVDGFGNALHVLERTAAGGPYQVAGQVAYQGGKPQLPYSAVPVTRGALRGLVIVGENTAIRRVRFEEAGVVDLGKLPTGDGLEHIVGIVGVQP